MRFNNNPPKRGDRRTIEKFTFFPFTHDGVTYWMEKIILHQLYIIKYRPGNQYGINEKIEYWETISVY